MFSRKARGYQLHACSDRRPTKQRTYRNQEEQSDEMDNENMVIDLGSLMSGSGGRRKLGGSDGIYSVHNHVYFYTDVDTESAFSLIRELRDVSLHLVEKGKQYSMDPPPLYLHINSYGGSIFAACAVIDCIQSLDVKVVSIIEGCAASAATLISVSCHSKKMTKNSFMLIHQLSSGMWGKMAEMDDEYVSLKKLMSMIKQIYMERTKMKDEKELDELLRHDIWWTSAECFERGLVDSVDGMTTKELQAKAKTDALLVDSDDEDVEEEKDNNQKKRKQVEEKEDANETKEKKRKTKK